MTAGIYNMTIEQGATFVKSFYYQNDDSTPINLNGYKASLEIKNAFSDTTALFSASSEPYDDYTGPNLIVIDGVNGKITLTIPATISETFDFDTAVYDLEISISGVTTRLLQGQVTLNPEVTKI